ncbi:hypothetical protein VTO73DRAFT_10197 [Trametes versicolor]
MRTGEEDFAQGCKLSHGGRQTSSGMWREVPRLDPLYASSGMGPGNHGHRAGFKVAARDAKSPSRDTTGERRTFPR